MPEWVARALVQQSPLPFGGGAFATWRKCWRRHWPRSRHCLSAGGLSPQQWALQPADGLGVAIAFRRGGFRHRDDVASPGELVRSPLPFGGGAFATTNPLAQKTMGQWSPLPFGGGAFATRPKTASACARSGRHCLSAGGLSPPVYCLCVGQAGRGRHCLSAGGLSPRWKPHSAGLKVVTSAFCVTAGSDSLPSGRSVPRRGGELRVVGTQPVPQCVTGERFTIK